jgi:DNA-binding NarL/FixJ family response regulator
MRNNIIIADKRTASIQEKQQLNLELAEIREISDLMFKKLEIKLRDVQAIEATVDKKKTGFDRLVQLADELDQKLSTGRELAETLDKKIATLQQLFQYAESVQSQGDGINRQQEIVALIRKGLASREIAEVLDMPQGEVELIVELNRHTT